MTRREGLDASETKSERGGREAAGDGASGRLIKAFQLGNIGNAKKRKPCG